MMPEPTPSVSPARRRLWIALGALVLVIILLAVFRSRKPLPPPAPEKAVPVTTIVAAARPYDDLTYLPARVNARFDATLAVEKGGIVTEILVEKGDRVEAGQVLLKQNDTTWRHLAGRAEIEFREAEKAMNRWEELKKTGAVSPSDFDAVRARYDNARIGLDDAKDQLAKCKLESPARGVIADRYLEVGENAGEAAPAFRLVDSDRVKLAVDVPERALRAVQPGAAIPFTVEAAPGRSFEGAVTFVSPAAREENNAFPVEVTADNADGALRPGMIARVALTRPTHGTAVVLPLAAILPRKGEYVVFVVEDGKASRRVVRLREIRDRSAVLESGILDGDEVVVEGARTLSDGMPVSVAAGAAVAPAEE